LVDPDLEQIPLLLTTAGQLNRMRTHLLPHLPSDMRQSLLTVEAECFETTVPKHFGYLGVFLAIFTEDEFTLVVVVLVLSSSPVFATLVD
jgi:hypothetical protein